MSKIMLLMSKKVLLKENSEFIISPACIEISGIHITKVKKHSLKSYQKYCENENLHAIYEIHDFGDFLISPSFVNCHTHVAMSFFRAILNNRFKSKNLIEDVLFKAESYLSPEDVQAFARMGAYENILNGNALIWDHYYHAHSIANACLETGISAVIAPTLQDISGPGVHLCEKAFQDTITIHEDNKFSKDAIFSSFGPHATDTVSVDLWERLRKEALSTNLPIHTHVAQSYEEVKRIYAKHKLTPIAFLKKLKILKSEIKSLLVHGIYLDKSDLNSINSKSSALVFCPFSQMIFQFPANILDWEKHKLQWFIATDCVASNDSMNIQKELRFVSGFPSLHNTFQNYQKILKKSSLKERTIFLKNRKKTKLLEDKFSNSSFLLNKILSGPGNFHPKFKAGSIEINALANLTVWDIDHPSFWPPNNLQRSLSMGDTTGAIHNMCIKGKWVGKNGQFTHSILTSDKYKQSLKEANERLTILLKKI
ncbi:amidohydrolase family protein [Fluviispira multicolorata]|uniref:Amidohydrolase family protein n=1 Tax=Fluviispira multicolorata TaxID=2654512 RepID=A0A833JCG5_9BACT|nr:amidohydrolase family protein [Fluviispira multicolorata]KAB8030693.1 amidohydrolase family protein [Fluviispira multicolorata]